MQNAENRARTKRQRSQRDSARLFVLLSYLSAFFERAAARRSFVVFPRGALRSKLCVIDVFPSRIALRALVRLAFLRLRAEIRKSKNFAQDANNSSVTRAAGSLALPPDIERRKSKNETRKSKTRTVRARNKWVSVSDRKANQQKRRRVNLRYNMLRSC